MTMKNLFNTACEGIIRDNSNSVTTILWPEGWGKVDNRNLVGRINTTINP